MRVLIDPEGTIVDADRLMRRLEGLPNSVPVLDYVVETVGLVCLETIEKGCLVYLHPKKIQSAMEAALYRTLLEQQPQRVLVSYAAIRSVMNWRFSGESSLTVLFVPGL